MQKQGNRKQDRYGGVSEGVHHMDRSEQRRNGSMGPAGIVEVSNERV